MFERFIDSNQALDNLGRFCLSRQKKSGFIENKKGKGVGDSETTERTGS